jgi:O-antigen ligase
MSFLEATLKRKNHFSYLYVSKFLHPSYTAVYVLFSMSVMFFYLRTVSFKIIVKISLIFCILFLLAFNLLLMVRASFLSLFFIFITVMIYEFFYLKNRINGILMFLFLLGSFVFVFNSSNFSNSANNLINIYSHGYNINENYDDRIYIWKASVSAIKHNPIFGVGISEKKEVLNNEYLKQGYTIGKENEFNSHNQFLDVWLEIGVIGFLCLLGAFISAFIFSTKNRNLLLFILSGILFINLLFESMLNRFSGVSIFVIMMSILFKSIDTNSKKNQHSIPQ